MTRRKRRPYVPPIDGDTGPDTEAQMGGATITVVTEENGAKRKQKRRSHGLDILYGAGKMSQRQFIAGSALHKAACIVGLSPDSAFTRVYVDSTPDYGAIALRDAMRSGKFGDLYLKIPSGMRGPVDHVAVKGLTLMQGDDRTPPYSRDSRAELTDRAVLQVALDLLANHLRL